MKKEQEFSEEVISENNEATLKASDIEESKKAVDNDSVSKEEKPVKPKRNNKLYFGYMGRIVLFAILFISLIGVSAILVLKSINVTAGKIVDYEENGNIDYKVYLKPNQFYEEPYLSNDLTYLAALINNIDTNFNYSFSIGEAMDLEVTYDVIAKLKISNTEGQQLFEKEYTLIKEKSQKSEKSGMISINDHLDLNYDVYNNLANEFRTTFGVETTSDLDVIVRVRKAAKNANGTVDINSENEMTMNVPLTKRTLNIAINSTGINSKNSVVEEEEVTTRNIVFLVIAGVLFIGSVACILKTLELLFLMSTKESKYDKAVKKILNDYDRLIVETETQPNFKGANMIKIVKFQELLDVRDNLKRPIMYYVVTPHIKSYFYILHNNNCYLMTVKAIDIENEKSKKR